eukprot:3318429-Pyramimonas_sp.AAC.1
MHWLCSTAVQGEMAKIRKFLENSSNALGREVCKSCRCYVDMVAQLLYLVRLGHVRARADIVYLCKGSLTHELVR